MPANNSARRFAARTCVPRREAGQALIFGLFALIGGLIALFFLFNTGQLTAEKTKLVNTADAVAYSAGVMHARALNFDAYTNRALIANEVMIAQAVSIASWTAYLSTHSQSAQTLMNCQSAYSVPVERLLLNYVPVCFFLGTYPGMSAVQALNQQVQFAAPEVVATAELAKTALQDAQMNLTTALLPARKSLMQEVADANYANDGTVTVYTTPLTDDFQLGGTLPVTRYSGTERGRFKQATLDAAKRDQFIPQRRWTDANHFPCITENRAEVRRRGGTELIGFDEWRAMDTASLHTWTWHIHFFSTNCDEDETPLGYAGQGAVKSHGGADTGFSGSRSDNPVASAWVSSNEWKYSGLPKFFDLPKSALEAADDAPPVFRLAIRLTRAKGQTRTSEGSSAVKPSGSLAQFDSQMKSGVLAAVSTSEVYFERPVARQDNTTELASLFNPFWQVHLVSTSSADIAKAMALGSPQ